MKRDRVAEHNRRMWDRLAKAGIAYTRPQGKPPRTLAGLRKFLDPHGRLRGVRLRGAQVLALAAGGGWDAVLFVKLGATTTLFDISRRQLETVRTLARKERATIRFVQGNMKDLSVFDDASFDVVWHSHSLVFMDDAATVFKEVGRVLAPGGTYRMSTVHPTTIRLYGTYDGQGWHPLVPYFKNASIPWKDGDAGFWEIDGKRVFAPTLEYGHRIETIINGVVAGGMVVDGLWEYSPKPIKRVTPGSDEHLESLFPAYLEIRARRLH